MSDNDKPFFTQAVEAFRDGDRRAAAALLHRELDGGHTPPQFLPNVQQFALRIGETELAIYAARKAVDPQSIGSMIGYWSLLAATDRGAQVRADIAQFPASVQDHPMVLHLRGALAAERGRFNEAEDLFRRALAKAPGALQTWGALAQLKTFSEGDPDLDAMQETLNTSDAPPRARASLLYGIGKAFEDIGDIDKAFAAYSQGAELHRSESAFDVAAFSAAADRTIAETTKANLEKLAPSTVQGTRSLFVTGMPRSGTTLTEQILLGHSLIASGAELNLLTVALTPVRGAFEKALAYQERHGEGDPWGILATDYSNMVDVHFGHRAPVVDKSLGEWLHLGLLLHIMPDARIAWLRRDPEDVALSCFTTDFTNGLDWTWSLTDIADMMKVEERLFAHWKSLFPDRILEVPYEQLVAEPDTWAVRLQEHFNLPVEEGLAQVAREDRPVRTASQAQVREPISTRRIGRAERFAKHLAPFRERYQGKA